MGGSGGGSYTNWNAASLSREVREDQKKATAGFEIQLSGFLAELLASYNSRDVDLVRERLEEAKDVLEGTVESTLDQIFGGSVAKHTYVDGISDIDSLVVVNGSKFEDHRPATILEHMREVLESALRDRATVEHGQLAVTITYRDGMAVQLLPAIRTEDGGLRIPAAKHAGWSEINPDSFSAALSKRNELCGGRLVPTIKLAKAVIANMPEQYRLSGYHVESLAIAAFRDYSGAMTTSVMLPHFFDQAKNLVLAPIKDRTGQSIHVDEHLGDANSLARQYTSRLLGNLAKRMTNASAAQSRTQWEALFAEE